MRRAFGLILCLCMTAFTLEAQPAAVPSATRTKALALEQKGDLAGAEAAWKSLLKTRSKDAGLLAHLGVLAAHQQHYKEAADYDRRALAINPRLPGLRLNLALALFKSGDLAAATSEFETLHASAPPGSPELQQSAILLGMSYYGLAQYDKAAPYLQEAADRDASSAPLLLALAHSYLWSHQLEKVMTVYRQILLINPDSAEADMIAGEALDEMKDNEGSTKMFRAAVAADPKLPNANFGLGYLLWTQKIYPEAAQYLQRELDNDPNHAQAMLYLADTELQMNHPDTAVPLLRRVVEIDASFGLAHLDLGIIATDQGRHDEALKELAIAAQQMPDDVNVHWRLGRLYRELGRKDEARAEFEKAGQLNKAADEDLFHKIANGQKRPPAAQQPPTDPPVSAQPPAGTATPPPNR